MNSVKNETFDKSGFLPQSAFQNYLRKRDSPCHQIMSVRYKIQVYHGIANTHPSSKLIQMITFGELSLEKYKMILGMSWEMVVHTSFNAWIAANSAYFMAFDFTLEF